MLKILAIESSYLADVRCTNPD